MPSVKSVCEAAQWLDRPISSIPIKSLGWLKKRALLRGSPIKGEDVHEGPRISWFDESCDTMIGSVRGVIYKVAITMHGLRQSPYTFPAIIANEISQKLQTQGSPQTDAITSWDAPDGNVVLQLVPNGYTTLYSVFITSQIIRSFI